MGLNAMPGVFASVLGVLIVGSAAVLAAPAQGTAQPGQITQARVWVQNRGRGEAVPVDLAESTLANPLRVRIIGGDPVTLEPVVVRVVPPKWEYRSITLAVDANVAQALGSEGAAGWETTGIILTTSSKDGNTFLLKRVVR
jgi:hypothetical protein